MPLTGANTDGTLPFVPLFTQPPDGLLAARHDLLRSQNSVFGRVPLRNKLGTGGGQIGLSGNDFFTGTVGTAAALQGAGIDPCLPAVPLITFPPDLRVASAAGLLWGESVVALGVPLQKQFGTALVMDIFS